MVQLKAGISSEAHAVDELYLSLAPHPSSNAAARTALASFFYHQPNACRDDFVGTFLIAVGEALANAIEHSDSHDLIEVIASIREFHAIVTVHDNGHGFVMGNAKLPPPDSERGRGLPLMQLCTDALEITTAPGLGTTVMLVRAL
jgi:nitrate/nitrite-specific signal transduction histidine kinase